MKLNESIIRNLKEKDNYIAKVKKFLNDIENLPKGEDGMYLDDSTGFSDVYYQYLEDEDLTDYDYFDWLEALAKKFPGKSKRTEELIRRVEEAQKEMEEDEDWEDSYSGVFDYMDIGGDDLIDYLYDYYDYLKKE